MFDLAGTPDWRVRISGLAGQEVAGKLIEIPSINGRGMKVRGYLLPADYARKGRRQQFVFLNGRPVEDTAISRALKDGYRGAVPEGSHPAAWLWIEMDPTLVDVNVHPAKREVRFHKPHEVRDLVTDAVLDALSPKIEKVVPVSSNDHEFAPRAAEVLHVNQELQAVSTKVEISQREPAVAPSLENPTQPLFPHRVDHQRELKDIQGADLIKQPDFRLIGPLHDRYIVMEGEQGVVLLDPVAARERVVYEYLLKHAGDDAKGVESQGLLVPELFELEALDAELVVRHESHFADAGIAVESFGGSTVKVSSVPSFLKVSDVRSFLLSLVDELSETLGSKRGKTMAFETFAATIAAGAGRGEPCRIDHAEGLLKAMFGCDLPYCSPDGRPTIIHISMTELDRKFGK